jgi:hypothetical protein
MLNKINNIDKKIKNNKEKNTSVPPAQRSK